MAENYPTSELADNTLLRIAEIYFDRAQKSKSSLDRQKAEDAYNEYVQNTLALNQKLSHIFRWDPYTLN